MRIALVEDNHDLRNLISTNLKQVGIQVECAESGEAALELIDPDIYDVIILDRGLPDMEGLDVMRILRDEHIKTPILILTAKDGLGDKLEGLNSGADDYLVKPFEIDELVARLHALCRRPQDVIETSLKIGNLEFSPAENKLHINDNAVEISVKEKEALSSLMRLPGRVVSKEKLQNILYGYGEEGSANSVEVVVHRLRKKLKTAQADVEIRNLRGIGYLIKEIEKN